MRIHLAGNHRGYAIARSLEESLAAAHEVVWHGPPAIDQGDDYPPLAIGVAQATVRDEDAGVPTAGIVVGGGGAGETVAANKVNGARAVPALTVEFVAAARVSADVNVLVIAADLVDVTVVSDLVDAFLGTDFSGDLDDARRLVNTAEFETAGTIEGWLVES